MNFGADADQFFNETAYKVLNAQGLAAAGSVIVSWNPDTDTTTVNRLHILRNGQDIDVLAQGKTFTVLRRETNLERAALDGTLTANLMLEGLQVGDIVDLATTTRHADPVFKGHSESGVAMARPAAVGRVYFRMIWPASKRMAWSATEGLGQPQPTTGADGTELVVDLKDAEAPRAPALAPARFGYVGVLEASQFADWAEVSGLMAPLYEKAATLSANSSLRAEIDKIKSAYPDAKARAMAALRLVEDQTRYVFLGLNNGGYVPANADLTWSRRFGDCKAKTALLLALLHGLGVEAQPALVSTTAGDGLDQRLPRLQVFDHVIVKARIGGKIYWLDGTRLGDRTLDLIPIPDDHWALPVQAQNARLEPLKPPALEAPGFESRVQLDESGGIDAPAPIHAEHIFTGDAGIAANLAFISQAAADAQHQMRAYWRDQIPWASAKSVAFTYDEARATAVLKMDGMATPEWSTHGNARDFNIQDSSLGADKSFARDPGPHADAPFGVAHPFYKKWTVSVIEPKGGGAARFIGGKDVDQTIAGVAYFRRSIVVGSVATTVASERSLAPEFPASEAVSAATALRKLASADVVLRLDSMGQVVASEPEAPSMATPKDAIDFELSGASKLSSGDFAAAQSDFDQAVRLEPAVAKHIYNRGVAEFKQGRLDLAQADFKSALKLNPDDEYALIGLGRLSLLARDWHGARIDFDRAIETSHEQAHTILVIADYYDIAGQWRDAADLLKRPIPETATPAEKASWLNGRCWSGAHLGTDLTAALAACDASLIIAPQKTATLDSRGYVLLTLNRFEEAAEAYDAVLKINPSHASSLFGRGLAKMRLGQAALAQDDMAKARAIDPSIAKSFEGVGARP